MLLLWLWNCLKQRYLRRSSAVQPEQLKLLGMHEGLDFKGGTLYGCYW